MNGKELSRVHAATLLLYAVNEALASFMEYKCITYAFPEMSGAALFQRATTPHGELFKTSCFVRTQNS